MTERTFHSLTDVIDCLAAARTLGLKNVTVSSTFQPTSSDPEFVPSSWTYRVSLKEEADQIAVYHPDGTPISRTDYADFFGNGHVCLGNECADCARITALLNQGAA